MIGFARWLKRRRAPRLRGQTGPNAPNPPKTLPEVERRRAQEIIETLSRNLLSLDASIKAGTSDPSLINEAFRAVHTLKGLAGLFGAVRLGALSHRLEDVLDDLRLGRIELGQDVLDVLFGAVEAYTRILQAEKSNSDEDLDVEQLFIDLERIRYEVDRSATGQGGQPAKKSTRPGRTA